jgi:hypothetical protein
MIRRCNQLWATPNILKNIIWHLFVGESHQVVKITVTYRTRKHMLGNMKERFNEVITIKFAMKSLLCLFSGYQAESMTWFDFYWVVEASWTSESNNLYRSKILSLLYLFYRKTANVK